MYLKFESKRYIVNKLLRYQKARSKLGPNYFELKRRKQLTIELFEG